MFRKLSCVVLVTISLLSIGSCFKIQPRIINGQASERGQFPFYALLNVTLSENGDQIDAICGGTLLNDRFVLTAARCVSKATSIKLDLGTLEMNNTQEEGRKSYTISKKQVLINPFHNEEKIEHDIALIKLHEPVEFSDVIQPVSLPKNCDVRTGSKFISIGNGYTFDDNLDYVFPDVLQHATVTVFPFEECQEAFGGVLDERNHICAADPKTGASACVYDNGSPLIDPTEHSLYAITSYIYFLGCGIQPVGYTKIFNYLPWIAQVSGLEIPKCSYQP